MTGAARFLPDDTSRFITARCSATSVSLGSDSGNLRCLRPVRRCR